MQLALFLVSVLVLPLVEFEPALDQERPPLFHVLGDDLGLAPEGIDIDESDLFLGLAGLGLPGPVDGQADAGDGGAFGGVAQVGVACEVAREDDFVEAGHRFLGGWLGGLMG